MKGFKLNRIDRWIVGVALLLLLLSVALILDNRFLFRIGSDTANLQQVASVSRISNDVRRRVSTDIVWLPISNPDEIFEGDSLFTGDGSEVEVSFKDGSKVTVDQGSLVVIHRESGRPRIDLSKGSFAGKLSGSSTILMSRNGKTTELSGKGAVVKITVGKDGKSELAVVSGKVELKTATGTSVVSQNQALKLAADGKPEGIKTYSIELSEPAPESVRWVSRGDDLRFAWKPGTGSPSRFVLEVATDDKFSHVVLSRPVASTSASTRALAPGKIYYWRVKAHGAQGGNAESMPAKFSLMANAAPRPMAPLSDPPVYAIKTLANKQQDGTRVLFRWQDDASAPKYRVQVARDPSFAAPLIDVPTENFAYEGSVPAPDGSGRQKYFWRVQAQDPARPDAPWSAAQKFTVAEKELDGAPSPLTPRPGETFLLAGGKARIPFKWKPSPVARTYELEISRSAKFDDPSIVSKQTLSAPEASWEARERGACSWRVRAVSADGRVTAFGPASRFGVGERPLLAAPSGLQRRLYARAGENPRFAWKAVPGAKSYRLQVAREPTFAGKLAADEETDSPELSWRDWDETEVYWRVAAIDEEGRAGAFSRASTLSLEPELGKPEGIAPRANLDVPVYDKDRAVATLTWKPVPGAEKYEVQLSTDRDYEHPLESAVVSGARHTSKAKLPEGKKLYWRVRAQAGKKTSEWAGNYVFSVKREAFMEQPVAETPTSRRYYTLGENPTVLLRWESVKKAKSYRIEVAETPDFSGKVQKLFTPNLSIPVALESGKNYYWRIAALPGSLTGAGRSPASIESIPPPEGRSETVSSPELLRIRDQPTWSLDLGFGMTTVGIHQSASITGAPVETGNGSSGLTFGSYLLDGEWWPSGHRAKWGMGLDASFTSAAVGFSGQAVNATMLRLGAGPRYRMKLGPRTSLVAGAGVKYMPSTVIVHDPAGYSQFKFNETHASESVAIRHEPDYGRYSFQLGLETTQMITSPTNIGLFPMAEAQVRLSTYSVGLKYVFRYQSLPLDLRNVGTGQVYGATATQIDSSVYLTVGFGL